MARKLDFKKNDKLVTKVMNKTSEDLNNKKRDIDVDLIDLNPDNESIFGHEDIDYMAETIEEDGFSGAIEVYALDNGRYEISSGHRRFLASKKLGHKTIPAIVSEDVDDKTKSKKLIKSNILNRKMTALKTAKALEYYKTKVLYDYPAEKTKELARVFNISHTGVKRYLQLLKLAPELQEYADNENVPYTNLLSLTRLDSDDQMKVFEKLKGIYSNTDNVFLAASNTVVEQKVNEFLGKEEKIPVQPPTAEQVMNRAQIEEDEEDNDVAPVPTSAPPRPLSYEERFAENQIDNELEDAKVIDMQLTVILKKLNMLLSGEYILSDDTKNNAIEQFEAVLSKLKAK